MLADDAWTIVDTADYNELKAHGLMRLPKDANGEWLAIGDEVAGYGRMDGGMSVAAICGGGSIIATETGSGDNPGKQGLYWIGAQCVHHHRKPAERLRDMAASIELDAGVSRKMARLQREMLEIADEIEKGDN